MSFKKDKDSEYLLNRLTFNDLELGIYRVIYGYRVRVGYIGEMSYNLDFCGGANIDMINLLYNGVKTIIEGQIRENKNVDFKEFPYQRVKPFYKDMNFLKEFCDLILKYRENDYICKEFEITLEKLSQ